jgi:ferrous iron transport protein B
MPNPILALAANPNAGKTTLFNALCGTHQRVGNWPGVTVERKEGQFRSGEQNLTLVDLPGVYSLQGEADETGLDETVARTYLLSGEADLIINVVDVASLERNLYLSLQILQMRLPTILVLNMMDVAEERGLEVDPQLLSQRLGVPVVPMIANRDEGIDALHRVIQQQLQQPTRPYVVVPYPPVVEDALLDLSAELAKTPAATVDPRWHALALLTSETQGDASLRPRLETHRHRIQQVLNEELDLVLADSQYTLIHQLLQGVCRKTRVVSQTTSDKIDSVVLNRWLGLPLFLLVMYLMFLLTINVGGALIDFFDIAAGTLFVDGVAEVMGAVGSPPWLTVLLAHGVGGGIQVVATFIPIIGILFLLLSILEDSGYMARAAFVMDRLMRLVGLPGKSFVPMLIGFGCNVPAIMATRTLENSRDRLLTIMMNPFMSCGARLPVYALFAAAFFPATGQNVVFGLYLIGVAAAMFTGLVLKNTLLRGNTSPFVMELPSYHLPHWKGVLLRSWDRLQSFMLRAGKVIVIMVMVLSLLNSIGTDGSFGNEDSEQSVLSATSRTLTPVFAPMGVRQENWPATVGIFTGVFAKEAVVGTLDSLYGALAQQDAGIADSEEAADFDLWGGLQEAVATIPANLAAVPGMLLDPLGLSVGDVSTVEVAAEEQEVTVGTFGAMVSRFDGSLGAFAYLLFVLMYFPCVAAMGAIYRETNWGWTTFAGCWTTGLAYWSAVMVYQLGSYSLHPTTSLNWIVGLLITMAVVLYSMHKFRFRVHAGTLEPQTAES